MEPYIKFDNKNSVISGRYGFCPRCHKETGWTTATVHGNVSPCESAILYNVCQICNGTSYDICRPQRINSHTCYYHLTRLWPLSTPANVPPPNADMPNDCQELYNEAAQVYSFSGRAAVALLRLCLQKLLQIAKVPGASINEQIKHLISTRFSSKEARCMDICRIIGNEGVHPGTIDFISNPDIVPPLFFLINLATDRLFSDERREEELYRLLPEEKRKNLEERNEKIEADKTASE